MIEIELNYEDWKNQVNENSLKIFKYNKNVSTFIIAVDGPIYYKHELDIENEKDFNSIYGSLVNKKIGNFVKREPFSAKVLPDGSKLFRRKHGYSILVDALSSKDLIVTIPYDSCKINKLEIIDANPLDTIDLIILDSVDGTYTSVPNYELNQFGFDVQLSALLYSDKSDYDAELYKGMQLKIVYKNKTQNTKKVGVNVILHEMVRG